MSNNMTNNSNREKNATIYFSNLYLIFYSITPQLISLLSIWLQHYSVKLKLKALVEIWVFFFLNVDFFAVLAFNYFSILLIKAFFDEWFNWLIFFIKFRLNESSYYNNGSLIFFVESFTKCNKSWIRIEFSLYSNYL